MGLSVIYRAAAINLFLLAFCAGWAGAAAVDSSLINRIQKKYEETKAFEASFNQTLAHKESGTQEKRTGNLAFQKPMLVRWQTAKPHEETLVVTDKEIWDYIPEEEIAYRYSPKLIQDSRSIIQVITGQSKLTKDFEVKNSGTKNGLTKLVLYPYEPSPQMVEAAIWVEPESGIIRRVRIVDFYGNSNDVSLNGFTPRGEINKSKFKFTPPRGVEVEDRIDKDIQEHNLFK